MLGFSNCVLDYVIYMAEDRFGTNRSLLGNVSFDTYSFLVPENTPLLRHTHLLVYARSALEEQTTPASVVIIETVAIVSNVSFLDLEPRAAARIWGTFAAADRMTFRVLLLVVALGLAVEEFAESAADSDKDCSLSLLQNNMQRSGPRGLHSLDVADLTQTEQVEENVKLPLAEAIVKGESNLLKSAFLKDVAHAILNKQAENRTLAREAARRRAQGSANTAERVGLGKALQQRHPQLLVISISGQAKSAGSLFACDAVVTQGSTMAQSFSWLD
eukprot:s1750_g9.t1